MPAEVDDRDTAGVIAPPPLIFLAALGIGLALSKNMRTPSMPLKVRLPAGAITLAAGASLMRSFVRAFAQAGTPLDPYKPSETVVTTGPYRRSRNPGYLGMVLTYAGICFVTDSAWAFAPLPAAVAVIDRGVIAREERYLERKFGDAYLDYKRRVRRWI